LPIAYLSGEDWAAQMPAQTERFQQQVAPSRSGQATAESNKSLMAPSGSIQKE